MASKGDINKDQIQPNLPERWAFLPFKEGLKKTGTFTKLKSKEYLVEGLYPVIDQGEKFISGYVEDEKLIYQGELPIVIFGDHTRVVKYIDFEFAAGADGTKILKPFQALDDKFFYYYLRALQIPSFGYSRHFKVFDSLDLPIPPLPEQKRIVDRLDALFGHLDTLKTKLDRIPELLKNFRQQVLTQAVTGKLTDAWREDSDYFEEIEARYSQSKKIGKPSDEELALFQRSISVVDNKSWKQFPLELLVDVKKGIPYGIVQTGKEFPNGIRTIRGGDIKGLKILDHLKLVDPEIEKSYKRTRLEGGEVVLAIRGTVGNAAVVPNDLKGSNISREVALIPVISEVSSKYVALLLQSPEGFRCLSDKVKGIAQRGINLSDIRRFVVPLPSKSEQEEIVRSVESLLDLADNIESQYQSLKEKIDKLPQAILNKAFKGELVPQDSNDEPARVLLERIKEEREKSQVKPKKTKLVKKASPKNIPTGVIEVKPKISREVVSKPKGRKSTAAIKKEAEKLTGQVLQDIASDNPIERHLLRLFGKKRFSFEEIPDSLKSDYEELRKSVYSALENQVGVEGSRLTMQRSGNNMYFKFVQV